MNRIELATMNLTIGRELEAFDGPLLVEYRSNDAFYVEKFGDFHKDERGQRSVRWLRSRVSILNIEKYLAGIIDLRTLLHDESGLSVIVERFKDTEIQSYVVKTDELPFGFMPDPDCYHDTDLRPKSYWTTKSFLTTGSSWDPDKLLAVGRYYSAVSCFMHWTSNGRHLPADILTYKYRGGFASGQAFGKIIKATNADNKPRVEAVAAASPGVIVMQTPTHLAERCEEAMQLIRSNDISSKIRVLRKWATKDIAQDIEVPEDAKDSIESLCHDLGIDPAAIFPVVSKDSKSETVVAGKLMNYFTTRLAKLGNGIGGVSYAKFIGDASADGSRDDLDDDDDDIEY